MSFTRNQLTDLETLSDPKLREAIENCKKGSRDAQYYLYKKYSKAMFNIALRITQNSAEAEDVLQEAFLSAFKHIQSWNGTSTFGAWLKRIVINRAVNEVRKRRFMIEDIDNFDFDDESNEASWDEIELQVEGVKSAITKLPEGYRMVLSLYLFEGYDHKEIAEILGITESTSKSQYLRAKQRLLKIIKERSKPWMMN